MADELTPAQLDRWIARHEVLHERLLEKAYHDLELGALREDVADLKESNKWALRLIVTLLISQLIALLYFVAGQIGG